MSKPTTPAIRSHLERHKVKSQDLDKWARYLQGLDWSIIKPLAQIAINSNVHPSLAAGMIIRSTRDQAVADTLRVHLKARQKITAKQ